MEEGLEGVNIPSFFKTFIQLAFFSFMQWINTISTSFIHFESVWVMCLVFYHLPNITQALEQADQAWWWW